MYEFYIGKLPIDREKEILEILSICDNEFYPPLSGRNSTTQKDLCENGEASGVPTAYFNGLKTQEFILVFSDGELAAFISYKDCEREYYISTLCVKISHRGKGLLHIMYDKIEEVAKAHGVKTLTTRTWSTNAAQTKTLEKHGYKITKTVENDRPAGIGTVYFAKSLETE